MPYQLEIAKSAEIDLAKLDRKVLQAIRSRLKKLAENAEDIHHLPLKGQWAGFYKLRAYGKYRVIYDLQREARRIVVVRVGNRSGVYDE